MLCEAYPSLEQYLQRLPQDCPNEPFQRGPRGSKIKQPLATSLTAMHGHEVCQFARAGMENSKYKSAHFNVQMWMLLHDSKTICIEVPLWLDSGEHPALEQFLGTCGPLSGHIDLLRVENGKIWIWDYKPNAAKEKYASMQTFLYAIMLSERTKIPLEEFRCGYFDEQHAFAFIPSAHVLVPVLAKQPVVE